MTIRPLVLTALAALALSACESGPVDVRTADGVPLRLDRRDPEPLIRATLGGYVSPEGGDPFEAGIVSHDGDDLTLHPQQLPADFRQRLHDLNGDGAIDWDELAGLLDTTYYEARGLPATLDELRRSAPYAEDDPAWFTVDVDGVMTAARRRIYVPEAALREAIAGFRPSGELRYPPGTWIIGEHRIDGEVVETTAKRRRPDGFWDFAVYDAQGLLTPATQTEPRALRAPTQCTGCHLGKRLFEPEKSFPAEAPDGPYGPRAYHVPDAWRSREATALFNEHASRDDGVLGLYATIYVGRLLDARQRGALDPADAALLESLGL